MGTPADLTDLYRARLGASSAGLMARLNLLWRAGFNPADPMASLSRISAAASTLVTGGQAVAANEAALYLRALTAYAAGTGMWSTAPYAVPPGLVGSTAAGMPMGDLLGISRSVYASAVQGGAESEQAATSASAWLSRVAASEPFRAANTTVTANASSDDRLTGRVHRVTRPDACEFCLLIADRGYLPAHAGFDAHAHCRCTASAEVSSRVYSKSGRRRARLAEADAGADRARAREAIRARAAASAPAYDLNGFTGEPGIEVQTRAAVDAALAPLSAANRAKFAGVDRLEEAAFLASSEADMSNAWAYYRMGKAQAGNGRLTMRGVVGTPGDGGDKAAHAAEASGWWSPTKAGAVKRTVAHELGHFVDDLLTGTQHNQVMGVVHMHLPPTRIDPLTDHAGYVAEWKKVREKGISVYGATNGQETIAELWAEFTLSPSPRPIAKAVGAKIIEFLG